MTSLLLVHWQALKLKAATRIFSDHIYDEAIFMYANQGWNGKKKEKEGGGKHGKIRTPYMSRHLMHRQFKYRLLVPRMHKTVLTVLTRFAQAPHERHENNTLPTRSNTRTCKSTVWSILTSSSLARHDTMHHYTKCLSASVWWQDQQWLQSHQKPMVPHDIHVHTSLQAPKHNSALHA